MITEQFPHDLTLPAGLSLMALRGTAVNSDVADKEQQDFECLKKALQEERTPETCSNLAYRMAKVDKNLEEAIPLVREAIDRDPTNPLHYLNYGRILSIAGDTKSAIETFRKGLEYGMPFDFLRELERFGRRQSPVFKKLPREHFLNRYVGLILKKMNLR